MRITIEYESSWRNSFLDGSNNESLPRQGRNFIGSMTALGKEGNFKTRAVTKDTVMGILNRLIGEQRKLYQARQDKDYYFQDIEAVLTDDDICDRTQSQNEIVYLRNISGSTDQNAFTGMIKSGDPAFDSDFSQKLWGILWFDLNQVVDFILDEKIEVDNQTELNPLNVIEKLENIFGEKAIDVSEKVQSCLDTFHQFFPDIEYKLTAKNQLVLISLYTSALYIQIQRLEKKYDMSKALTKSGGLSGISKRGFTKKDFMDRYTTGKKKLLWGNPYVLRERKKGEGEISHPLTKANGTLEINLNITRERARDLEQKILDAGVSSFYLGKKGLAYVASIDTRENP